MREFVPKPKYELDDDHIMLHEIGRIPCIDVIDFDPNGHIRVIVGGGGKIYRFRDGGWVDVVGLTAAGMADEQLVAGLTGNDPALLKKLAKVIGA